MLQRIGAAMASAALVVAVLHPAPAAAGRIQIGFPTKIHIEDEDGRRLQLRINEDGRTIKLQARGHFELNDDETEVESIESDGTFRLEDRRWGRTSHRYEIRGLPGGGIERTYWRGGDVRELDAEGREWLADALAVVVLNTDFGLEHHLERVLERDGMDDAISTVESIDGDHSQRKGYRFILEHVGSDPTVSVRIVESAAQHIGSDHELAELLIGATDRRQDDALLHACAAATGEIGSDHERSRVLRWLVDHGPVSPETAAAIVASAADIGSDHQRAEAMIAIADSRALDAGLAPAYFEVVGDIGSDHEKGRTLIGVLAREPRDLAILEGIVHAASRIGSDHQRSEVLIEMARQGAVLAPVAPLWVESTGEIGSDHEHGRVLIALVQSGALEPPVLELVLADAATIGSDARKADVLEAVLDNQRLDETLRDAFQRAADTLGSDAQHRRVLRKLDESRM